MDGHDLTKLIGALDEFKTVKGKPTVIIAHTLKGKGVSFMENDNNWHYRIPTAQEVALALKEIEQ